MGMCCAYVIPLGKLGRLFLRDTNADDYDDVRSSRTQFDYIISQYASGGGGERFLSVSGCFQAAFKLLKSFQSAFLCSNGERRENEKLSSCYLITVHKHLIQLNLNRFRM